MDLIPEKNLRIKEITKEGMTDPRIKITDNSIVILPYYFNEYFLTSLVPILMCIVCIFQGYELLLNILFAILIILCGIGIIYELRVYNYVYINPLLGTITIVPNTISKLFRNTQKLNSKDVKRIDYAEDHIFVKNRRFTISVFLKNDEKYILITTKKQTNADKIVELLQLLI